MLEKRIIPKKPGISENKIYNESEKKENKDNKPKKKKKINFEEAKTEKENEIKGKKEKDRSLLKIKQFICNYCGKEDKNFKKQEDIDEHLKNECKVFTNCVKCKKNIEVRLLTEHQFNECENKSEFKKCERCKEPIQEEEYESHTKENNCNVSKSGKDTNRCPLCHTDVQSLDRNLVHHLVDQGCKSNSRK